MKSRTILNVALFISIVFASASLVGFVLSFIIKGEQVFVPVSKNYYKSVSEESTDNKKESFYFGNSSDKVSSSNVFDASARSITLSGSTAGDLNNEGGVPEASEDDIAYYFENPDKCPLMSGYTLGGTIVADKMEDSVAIMKEGKGTDLAIIARVGSEVTPGVILALVWRNFVVLKTNSGIKCIGEGVAEGRVGAGDQKVTESAPGPNPGGDQDIDIRKVGENQYVMKRQDLQKVTGNLNALARQARIVPSKKDNGFKVFSIAPNSLYQKIGIQNGDVIRSINGIELSTPDKALEAYSRLQSASKLSLDIVRRGQPQTMEYTIE